MNHINGNIKIYLSPGAMVPLWIIKRLERHTEEDFSIDFEEFEGSQIRVLKLIGGEASFCYPNRDDVVIKLPGEVHRWASGFDPTAVLQITNGDNSVVEQNRLLCPNCHDTTGRVSHHKVGETVTTVFKCKNGCASEWES